MIALLLFPVCAGVIALLFHLNARSRDRHAAMTQRAMDRAWDEDEVWK